VSTTQPQRAGATSTARLTAATYSQACSLDSTPVRRCMSTPPGSHSTLKVPLIACSTTGSVSHLVRESAFTVGRAVTQLKLPREILIAW
jgi:hypothetical protein